MQWLPDVRSIAIPAAPALPSELELPQAGEDAARRAWRRYRDAALGEYPDVRDRPDLDRTSRMSVYLKWGAIHPRTMLADLAPRDEKFRAELAWREFHAAV